MQFNPPLLKHIQLNKIGDGRRVKKIAGTEVTVFDYNAGGTLVAEYSIEIEGVETAQVS